MVSGYYWTIPTMDLASGGYCCFRCLPRIWVYTKTSCCDLNECWMENLLLCVQGRLILRQRRGEEYCFFSLFLPLVTFVFSTTASSIFLLAHFQNCIGALVVYEVEHLEGFLTNMLVLLEASTSLVKLRIYKFSK